MFGGIKRQSVYSGAINADGPKRVEGASWFVKEMEKARNTSELKKLYSMGSDLIYCNRQNVRDTASKRALNDLGIRMTQICERNGWRPNVSNPAFEV